MAIAGGMQGLGRAIAAALARNGASLALADGPRGVLPPPPEADAGWQGVRSVVEEARSSGVDAFAAEFDLKDGAGIDRFVDDVVGRFGRIDILVNNHRVLMGRDQVPMPELDQEVWREFFEINVHATFHLTQRVARAMIERGSGGRIVHIGSDMSRVRSRARPPMPPPSSRCRGDVRGLRPTGARRRHSEDSASKDQNGDRAVPAAARKLRLLLPGEDIKFSDPADVGGRRLVDRRHAGVREPSGGPRPQGNERVSKREKLR